MASEPVTMKNLIQLIYETANHYPERLVFENVSYSQFIHEIGFIRGGLAQQKIQKNRVVVLQKPSQALIKILVALMAEGNILIFIDPSLSLKIIKEALPKTKPTHLILDNKLFWLYALVPELWQLKRIRPLTQTTKSISHSTINFGDDDPCFYSLTTGSTGPAKIVPIPFSVLKSRQQIAKKYLPRVSPDVHLAGYTLSNLQNLTEGATCLMDLNEENLKLATRLSGPPGKISGLVETAFEKNSAFPKMKSILLGGAPIPNWLISKCKVVFPNAEGLIIYGSTESEPISRLTFSEALRNASLGYPVGQPVEEIEIRLHPLNVNLHFPPSHREIGPNQVGELWINGPHVIKYYEHSVAEQESNKVKEGDKIWHRTGDIVYKDSLGNLYLLGRIKDILRSNDLNFGNLALEYSIESNFPFRRVAAKSWENEIILYVEPFPDRRDISQPVLDKLKEHLNTWNIKNYLVKYVDALPVDRRHQWKIQRSLIK